MNLLNNKTASIRTECVRLINLKIEKFNSKIDSEVSELKIDIKDSMNVHGKVDWRQKNDLSARKLQLYRNLGDWLYANDMKIQDRLLTIENKFQQVQAL